MSNSSTNEEILLLQSVAKFLDGYTILFLIVIGTIGNLLNIIVFIRHKTLRQMSNVVFLITFFISNLTLLWSSRFPRAMLTITGIDPLVGSIVYCKVRWLFGRWSFNMSFTCICLSSVERFLNTSRNQRYRSLITFKRAFIIISVISVAYVVIFMPDAIYYSGYRCTASNSDRAIYQQFISYFNLTMTNSIPVVILGTFCLLTWYNLWLARHLRRNKLQQQVNRMMIVEFTMIFISSLPNFVFNIYTQINQSVVKSELRLAQETVWRYSGVILSFTLNVGTFYIYVIVSSAYRRNVATTFCFKKQNQVAPKQSQLFNIKNIRPFAPKAFLRD